MTRWLLFVTYHAGQGQDIQSQAKPWQAHSFLNELGGFSAADGRDLQSGSHIADILKLNIQRYCMYVLNIRD